MQAFQVPHSVLSLPNPSPAFVGALPSNSISCSIQSGSCGLHKSTLWESGTVTSSNENGALQACVSAYWSSSSMKGLLRRRKRKVGRMVLANTNDGNLEFTNDWMQKSEPRRIALFVEPSPFAYVSGYKNRFQNFIRYLREMGDEVLIVTTHEGVPREFYGAKVIGSWSFPCPWYKLVPLSLALSPRIISEVSRFKPDIIHASSPGVMVFGALVIAKLLNTPLVMSYHTHVPMYIPKYTFSWLVKPMWLIIKFLHRAADLTLVTSSVLGKELKAAGAAAANKIRVWQKGVDSDKFHPRFKNDAMRERLTDGESDRPLAVYVGRLGAEKNLDFLQKVMQRLPEARTAFVGDGPFRKDLEQLFADLPVVFTGMLQGEELSQAYASADVFIMPSETETLGFVVLEAMASGVPVVAARAGGIPDIVSDDGDTGFLYTPGDVDDCVDKVKALFSSEELRRKIGDAGRKEVEKFDWRASTRQVRNEEYSAAIWFWQKRRHHFLRRLALVMKKLHIKPGFQ